MIEATDKAAFAVTRRGAFIGLGALGAGLAMTDRATAARSLPGANLYKVVYDDRVAEGRALGARFAASGFSAVAVQDDPTWLWFDDLHHHWRGAGVAGLTTPAVAMSLKMMAELAGLRAVIWGRHRVGPSSPASHVVTATEYALASWRRLANEKVAWTGALHDTIVAAAAQPTASARLTHVSGPYVDGAREMVSWLFVPVVKGTA